MSGLPDLVPAKPETVVIQGQKIVTRGLSIASAGALVLRFPALKSLFSEQPDAVAKIMTMGDEIVSAIIAAGCGSAGDEKAEAVAASLSADEQLSLLAAIIKQTLPRGVGPFVESLGAALEKIAPPAPLQASSVGRKKT